MAEPSAANAAPSEDLSDPTALTPTKWRKYAEAKLGFRNHWYPIFFSEEIEEGKPVPVTLLGEQLLVNRAHGKVYTLVDRCMHRGVRLSHRTECFTPETISCWYHGFTYRWDSGELCTILTQPKSAIIGKRHIKAYPTTEAKGIVFIFVGDIDPPDLCEDVPPGFLDENFVVRGIRRPVAANWRMGVENGFDTTHIYMHRDSDLLVENSLAIPLGFHTAPGAGYKPIAGEQGPYGIYDEYEPYPINEAIIDDKAVIKGHLDGEKRVVDSTSIWLPCVLKVDPWPDPTVIQTEWYVPMDEENHWYFPTLGRYVDNAAEEQEFHEEFHDKWKNLALHGFNDEDVGAREAMQEFYRDDEAWIEEQLFEPDTKIVAWRRVAAECNRGVQTRDDIRKAQLYRGGRPGENE